MNGFSGGMTHVNDADDRERFLQRLRRLDVCALSDALDALERTASISGLLPLTAPKRICGFALTVRLAAGTAPKDAPARHLCTSALDVANSSNIIVVEQRTGIDAAGWGGVLSNAAIARGVAGVIVEGPARDVDESADLGFPVYARSATARTARGRICEAESGGTILLGDCEVNQGDYVAADRSGAIVIKPADIEQALALAESIAQREFAMTKRMLAGEQPSLVMGANYENMLQRK